MIAKTQLQSIIAKYFLGEIEQVPPKVSAIKVEGRRAYSLFRENKNLKNF